ncbi:MAG: hypothetical protein ACJAVN_002153 [Roseivirga sp.]|jgi:hypothetical protein
MNNRFLPIILVLLVLSCDQRSTIKESTPISELDVFQSYKIEINSPKVKLTNQIASVEIARLEETEESLLSDVREIFTYEDRLLFYYKGSGDIYIFDQSGNFKNRINRSGNGPEEYRQISDLWLESDTISIHIRGTQNLKKYDFQGNFIESLRLPAMVDHLYSYSNGYIFGTNFVPLQDSIRYQWGIWDEDLSLSRGFLPYDESWINELVMYYSINTIHPYQDDRLLIRMHSDSVYLLRDDQLKPIVHFDFGEDWFWTDRGIANEQDMTALETSDQAWENEINVGAKSIYLKSIIGFTAWEHFLINRQNGKVNHLDMTKGPEELFTLYTLRWKEGRLLCAMPSDEVVEFINQLGEENVQFKEGTSLDIIEASENPVLLWIKFKTND